MRKPYRSQRGRINEGPGAGVTINFNKMRVGWYDETEDGWPVHGQMTLRSAYDVSVVHEGSEPLGYLYLSEEPIDVQYAEKYSLRYFTDNYTHDDGSAFVESVSTDFDSADIRIVSGEVLSPGYTRGRYAEGAKIKWEVSVRSEIPYTATIQYTDEGVVDVHDVDDTETGDHEATIEFHPIVSTAFNDLDTRDDDDAFFDDYEYYT